jgi:hypothetical protein
MCFAILLGHFTTGNPQPCDNEVHQMDWYQIINSNLRWHFHRVALNPLNPCWNLEVLIFAERGKPENPKKNPRSKGENQQTTLITYDPQSRNQTRGHRGERRVLPPLHKFIGSQAVTCYARKTRLIYLFIYKINFFSYPKFEVVLSC